MPRAKILAMLLVVSWPAEADLTDNGYVQAKILYQQARYAQAAVGLRQYEANDSQFLASNPELKRQIDAAIKYCDDVPVAFAIGAQITETRVAPPARPALP
jgi:hypothetical protein